MGFRDRRDAGRRLADVLSRYRGECPEPDLDGRVAILVAEGVINGLLARAASGSQIRAQVVRDRHSATPSHTYQIGLTTNPSSAAGPRTSGLAGSKTMSRPR